MAEPVPGDRFAEITPDDHAGSIWIASILCLIYSILTLALRGHLRRKVYGWDDCLALVATIIQVGEVVAVIVGLDHGLGKTQGLLRQSELTEASRATFAAQILFILSAAAAKASTLCLMMRLFNLVGPNAGQDLRQKAFHLVGLVAIVGVTLWGILSIVALSVDCAASGYIQGDEAKCSHQFLRWQLITAFDAVTEGIILLIVITVVWPVHLALSRKFQVVLAFSFRLPIVMLSVLHLHYVANYTGSGNPGIAIVPVIVIQQVELCWSLISATVPNLKSFVKSFSSGFGIQLDASLTQNYGSGRYGRSAGGYELGSIPGKGSHKSDSAGRSFNDPGESRRVLPASTSHITTTTSTREHDSIDSAGSQDSRGRIIRKDVQWDVRYEPEVGRAV